MAAARRRTPQERRDRYGGTYPRDRAALLAAQPLCQIRLPDTCTYWAQEADHVPPIAEHDHHPGTGCCTLRAACRSCNRREGGWRLANARRRRSAFAPPARPIPPPSRQW